MRGSGRISRRRGAFRAGGACLSAVVVLLAGCLDAPTRTFPPAVRGYWTTEDEPYRDRAFEVLEGALVFHTGEGAFDVRSAREVTRERLEDGRVLFTATYAGDAGQLYDFPFVWDSAGRTIEFRNRPSVTWTPAADPP